MVCDEVHINMEKCMKIKNIIFEYKSSETREVIPFFSHGYSLYMTEVRIKCPLVHL